MKKYVIVWQDDTSRRSQVVCEAIANGISHCGDIAEIKSASEYHAPIGHAAVFYGLRDTIKRIYRDYRATQRPTVLFDIGYWGRRDGFPPYEGYHKMALNGLHPSAYFRHRPHTDDRLRRFGLTLQPWRQGGAILVAGMSFKSCWAYEFEFETWERRAIALLRQHTRRPIRYRPKASCASKANRHLADQFSDPAQPIEQALTDCWASVSHHSNVAIDGLIAGVPCFVEDGPAHVFSKTLDHIESPCYPGYEERWQFLADLAYAQWSVAEMRDGLPWAHLKAEGHLS